MPLPAALPPLIPEPFAQNADPANINNPIPPTTGSPGLASYDIGFPPITFQPIIAGGIPPEGQDFNGIFFAITAHLYYLQSGQRWPFNATVAAAIGGYPIGAIVAMDDGTGEWVNGLAANSANPNSFPPGITGSGSGWFVLNSVGVATVACTSPTTTLTGAQAKKPVIVLTGALTANVRVAFPQVAQEWLVVNLTTGGFNVTLSAGGGTQQASPAGGYGSPLGVYSIGDGNLYPSVSPLGVPISQSADPLTLVERTNGGYVYATYFNQTSVESENPPIGQVFIENASADGFMRKASIPWLEGFMLLSAIGGQVTAGQVPAGAVTQYSALILASAALTGTPTAPTQAPGTSNTTVATTAFVNPGASPNPNGYRHNPDGTISQWGSFNFTANGGTTSIGFNIPFPSQVFNVNIGVPIAPSGLGGAGSYQASQPSAPTLSGFQYRSIASSNVGITVTWTAEGK